MKILNLDAIAGDDKAVIIGGVSYTLPANLPVKTVFRMMANSERAKEHPEDSAVQEEALSLLFEVIKSKNPGADFERFSNSLNMAQYTKLIQYVYGMEEALEDEKKSSGEPSGAPPPSQV